MEFPFCIRDPDGHALEELITAGEGVTASLNTEQNILYVTGVTEGVNIPIHVLLTDPYGESAETSMLVSVLDRGTEALYDDFSDSTGGWQETPAVFEIEGQGIGQGFISIEDGLLHVNTVEQGGWGGAFKDLDVEDWTITIRMRSLCDCTGNLVEIFREDDVAYWLLMEQGGRDWPFIRFSLGYRDYSFVGHLYWLGMWWAPGHDHRLRVNTLIPNHEWVEISLSTVHGELRFSVNGVVVGVVYDEDMVFSKMRRIRLMGFGGDRRHLEHPAEYDFIRVLGTVK